MMGAGSHMHVVTWRICTPRDGHAVCLVSFFAPLTGDVRCIHPCSDRWSLPRCNAALLSCQTRHSERSESPHSTGLRRRRQRSFARRGRQRTTLLEHSFALPAMRPLRPTKSISVPSLCLCVYNKHSMGSVK
jgi:hypothetical protein